MLNLIFNIYCIFSNNSFQIFYCVKSVSLWTNLPERIFRKYGDQTTLGSKSDTVLEITLCLLF